VVAAGYLSADIWSAMRIATLLYAAVVMSVEVAWIMALVYGVVWLAGH
jgi:hypothetical protein